MADEPTSMLDVSLRVGILNLIAGLRDRLGSGVLYITHDLAVAKHLCDRIAVMQGGHLVELDAADEIVDHPVHPYTQRLIDAAEQLGHG